jgi:16S rRNA (uracil1498-N3)-methyltransferase
LTSNRFFIEDKLQGSSLVSLRGKEHHHLSKVARIKPGEIVWLIDKHGIEHRASVEDVKSDETRLLILETGNKKEFHLRILLAQVILKSKKMDLVIQKATELGAHGFQPILSQRSIVNLEGKPDTKMERWKRIMIEAAKQSGRASIPDLFSPERLDEFLEKKIEGKKYFLNERGGTYLRDILISAPLAEQKSPKSVILLIGPEGGWTEKEEQDIMESQYEAVSLGALILRSETAAIASLAMISHFWKNEDVS